MTLISQRGEFPTMQALRAAYLKAPDRKQFAMHYDGGEWDKSVIHASDAGACPRQVMYRLTGTPEKPRSPESEWNRTVMFESGYVFHYLTYSALRWAGLLAYHERPLELPYGVSGSCDAIFQPDYREEDLALYDCKTVLPNALKYSWDMPKVKDCLQLGAYSLDPDIESMPILYGLIEYVDRAGSNTPLECIIDLEEWADRADRRLEELTEWEDMLPASVLPPEMAPRYVGHYSSGYLESISYERAWECGYCDYHLTKKEKRTNPNSGRQKEYGWTQKESTCKPFYLPPHTVATVSGGSLKKVTTGHEEGVERWFASARKHYAVEVEE
ncbi:MAG TPA: hypothetical protein VM537_13350 [Anaerolineae bacterium]|nr:hypothetical protein [Anaerolineae bacterium]